MPLVSSSPPTLFGKANKELEVELKPDTGFQHVYPGKPYHPFHLKETTQLQRVGQVMTSLLYNMRHTYTKQRVNIGQCPLLV